MRETDFKICRLDALLPNLNNVNNKENRTSSSPYGVIVTLNNLTKQTKNYCPPAVLEFLLFFTS